MPDTKQTPTTDPRSPWYWMAWWSAVLDGRHAEAEAILSGRAVEVPRG